MSTNVLLHEELPGVQILVTSIPGSAEVMNVRLSLSLNESEELKPVLFQVLAGYEGWNLVALLQIAAPKWTEAIQKERACLSASSLG